MISIVRMKQALIGKEVLECMGRDVLNNTALHEFVVDRVREEDSTAFWTIEQPTDNSHDVEFITK